MYGLNDRAHQQPDRSAEETQLYQTVDVQDSRLKVRSYTAARKLYADEIRVAVNAEALTAVQ